MEVDNIWFGLQPERISSWDCWSFILVDRLFLVSPTWK